MLNEKITNQLNRHEIGSRIRFYRKQNDITMSEVGTKALGKQGRDAANSFMQRIEEGKRRNLLEEDIQAIIRYFGLSQKEFLEMKVKRFPLNPIEEIHPDMSDHIEALALANKIGNKKIISASLVAIRDLIDAAIDANT